MDIYPKSTLEALFILGTHTEVIVSAFPPWL